MTAEPATTEPQTIEPAGILVTAHAPALRRMQGRMQAPPAPRTQTLPFAIDPPRGGVFDDRARHVAAAQVTALRARDTVLSAIWPLVSASAGPAPSPALATICEAAVARLRSAIAIAVASFRSALGAAAREFDGAERVVIQDLAMTLKVDETELLDRTALLLSPQELMAAAVPGRTSMSDTVERAVGGRVEVHMLELIRNQRRLTETTRALVLSCLSTPRA